jgi:3-keto-5-aminohexanoate cleavage enzyme
MAGDKVIISCALSGVAANRSQCPGIPYTPDEYGDEAKRAAEQGCSIVHIHARKPDGTPTQDVESYRAIKDAILKRVPNMIINFSTGAIGYSREQRIASVPACLPDIAALNMGTMNYAKYSEKRKDFVFQFTFENSFADIIFYLKAMMEHGVRPEMECFDTGHVGSAYPLIDMGVIKPPYEFSFILGVDGGVPATTRNIIAMIDNLPKEANWQVIGISREQWKLAAAALTLGGNVRVGFEDNFYLPEGKMAKSNGELVERVARLARDTGREPATIDESRAMLHLPLRRAAA